MRDFIESYNERIQIETTSIYVADVGASVATRKVATPSGKHAYQHQSKPTFNKSTKTVQIDFDNTTV